MPVVTLLDTLGIQSFIFATNRLRDAVGGSDLVDRLGQWAAAVCSADDVLMAAGGNAWLRFADEATARSAMASLSRRARDEAPGLELVAVHEAYQAGDLASAIESGLKALEKAKRERSPGVPLLGLGVTAPCRETRGPATHLNEDGQPIAASVFARRQARGTERWNAFLSAAPDGQPYEFPTEVEQLGRSRDERSLLGIVHVDGNGVGRRLRDWRQQQANARRDDEAFRNDLQTISGSLNRLGREALTAVVQRVIAARPTRTTLPLRPLILGGDDLTFVCDGRMALDLAVTALGVFETSDLPLVGPVRACAGIALVPVRAPLLRGYELAAAACAEAKKKVREVDQCALDWHLGFAGAVDPLSAIRQRQYTAGPFALTCRPYLLGTVDTPGTWRWLAGRLLGPDGLQGPAWSERRNKVKGLRDLLRDGPDAVRRGLAAWRVAAPDLRLPAGLDESGGFLGERTPLLDAVELLDIHQPLEDPS